MGKKLLRVIFGIYFLITLTVTTIQLAVEYSKTKTNIINEVMRLRTTFSSSIGTALWEFNQPQIESILSGLKDLNFLVGSKIEDTKGELQASTGIFPTDKDIKEVPNADFKDIYDVIFEKDNQKFNLIQFKFPVFITEADTKTDKSVGVVYFYTSESVVLDKVKDSFIIIFINSVVKTMALWLVFLLTINRMVERPLVQLTNIVKSINPAQPDAENANSSLSNIIDRNDELGDLSQKFILMLRTISGGINVINDLNKNLEQKVADRTLELQIKNRDITAILTNIKQGILTFSSDMKIEKEYSKHLESVYETNQISGADVIEFIFQKSTLPAQAQKDIRNLLICSFDEELMTFEINSDVLPTEAIEVRSDGDNKIVELIWEPILSDEKIVKFMLIVRDVSLLRKLQAESAEKKKELDTLNQIIKPGVDQSLSFIENVKNQINIDRQIVMNAKNADKLDIPALFRSMHTIKGNALTIGLKDIGDAAGLVEAEYQLIRSNKDHWVPEKILETLNDLEKTTHYYSQQIDSRFSVFKKDSVLLSNLESIIIDSHFMEKRSSLGLSMLSGLVTRIVRVFKSRLVNPIKSILSSEFSAIVDLAKKLDKPTPNVVIHDHGIEFHNRIKQILRDIFVHLLRNSLDHGIESAKDRRDVNKPEEGTITINVENKGSRVEISIQDDGRGLNLAALKRKGESLKLLKENATNEETAEMMFASGVSTAEKVSDISGRGVGMDAVRNFLEQRGGRVAVNLLGPKNAAGFAPFSLQLEVPLDWVYIEPNTANEGDGDAGLTQNSA